jgi:DNA primase catalytic core
MKIDPNRLEAMKRLHLPTIMMEYGVMLKAAGLDKCLGACPFHEDKKPSLSVGKRGDKWVWNCFGCGSKGNVIDFVMKKEEKPFSDAYQILDVKVDGRVPIEPISPPMVPPAPSAASSVHAPEFLARVVEIYHNAYCETKTAQDYLTGRGIKDGELIRHFKIGFAEGRLRRMLPEDPAHEFTAGLKAVGVLNEKGGEFFHGCVTFPILDENGGVAGIYGRRAVGTGPAHLYLPGPRRGVWNGAAFKAHREIILTESIIDALSLCVLGFTNAVPLYGVNGLTDDHLRLMREHRTAGAWVCLDNDDAGRNGREWIKAKLSVLGVTVSEVHLPDGVKDINEALQKGLTAEGFRLRMPIAKSAAAVSIPAPVLPSPASLPAGGARPTIEEKDGAFFVGFGVRSYRVKGLSARNLEHLRVNVKVEVDGGSHLDTFDLYSSFAREKFVSCCRKVMKADAGELHRELNQLIEVLEGLQAKGQGGKESEEGEPKMTPEDEAESLARLKDPELLPTILREMAQMGPVGEEHNKAIAYMVGVSRKMEDPLSCVIISQSSAGKSFLADTVERMTPPEDVLMYSRMTQYSIYYAKRDGFKHKLLISEERAGAEEADYPIRSLQSKKRLTLAVPVKDPETNQMRMEERVVEGPIAYIETTTNPRINDENATRCFELYMDESESQTKLIHASQRRAKTLGGLKEKQERERIQRRHWNMQRLLRPVWVVIPFAEGITFPARWLRTRRDNQRLLSLVEAVAFLHQHQRERGTLEDGREYILATAADYETAYTLAVAVMGESLTDLKKPQRELLKSIAAMTTGDEGVTRRAIREATGLADTRLRSLLGDLVSLEYLREVSGGGQGRLCRYIVTERLESTEKQLVGLTTPEELAKRLGGL